MMQFMKQVLPSDPRRRLWLIAGGLFVTGNVYKFVVWNIASAEIQKSHDAENKEANRHLNVAHNVARKFDLPALTPDERARLSVDLSAPPTKT
jgi:hypothetical protein